MKNYAIKYLLFFMLSMLALPALSQQPDTVEVVNSKALQLYFRWDKADLQKNYMDNERTLEQINRLFSNPVIVSGMDSVAVSATASPEGEYHYNKRLSERRVKSVIQYLAWKHPEIDQNKIVMHALGEDWDGFRRMVEADINVPYRKEVLKLIDSNLKPDEKERRLKLIGNGDAYRYIEKNIFRYLRTGGTLVIFYPDELEPLIQLATEEPIGANVTLAMPEKDIQASLLWRDKVPDRYVRPVAIKTNLLFDIATLFNVELEFPIGRHFSLLGEWTFPWWGGLGNRGGVSPVPAYSERYTMQMLSGGLEARYWFPRSSKLDSKAKRWGDYNPLNGWFIGLYGGAGMYDFQFDGRGMQGEFFISAGISGGYAHPIGKNLHMEYSLGLGYLNTEYYNYTAMDGHKVVDIMPDGQYDRRKQMWIGPTKAKISLVWIPRFKVKSSR